VRLAQGCSTGSVSQKCPASALRNSARQCIQDIKDYQNLSQDWFSKTVQGASWQDSVILSCERALGDNSTAFAKARHKSVFKECLARMIEKSLGSNQISANKALILHV
jgi:hypothetical protein